MSQTSTATSISIPSEIVLYQDDEFLEDIERVDELYFSKLVAPKSNVRDRQFCDLSSDSETDTSDFGDVNYDSDSESDNDNYDGDVYIPNEVNDTDTKEYIIRSKFQNDTCGCKEFYGMPCSTKIDFDAACEFRDHCLQCTREELDTILKVEMFAHRRSGSVTQSKKHREKERERPFQEYYFNGCRVCRTTFCFVHAVERKKLHKVARSLDTEGFLPRTHGNSGKAPHNSLSVTDRDRIKTFITKYASDHALPLPGRLPNYKSEKVLLLPSDTTTADIHAKYEILAEEMNFRRIHLRTFQRTWHELCPFITIMKPCTDLCQLCQNFSHQLSTVSNMNDEEKEEILSTYTQHVSQAKQQRDYYRHQCTTSKEVFISLPEECKQTGNAPCTVDVQMHYSWDYAQQVHFPHHAQQVGPIFFKTPRKCNVFGICCEGSGKQVFYLIDEAENTGKGANSVISMVHHFFQYHGYGEKTASIHFDNCSGQNKNNFVLWYALWRVLVDMHSWWTTLTRSHMLHEAWRLDTYFGLICAMVAAAALSVIFELLGVIMLRIIYICWPGEKTFQISKCTRTSLKIRLITSIFHICGVIIGYILMLCVMTMNIWILFSILLGTSAGHYFKQLTRKEQAEVNHLKESDNHIGIRSNKETGSEQCELFLNADEKRTGSQSETEPLKKKSCET